VDSGGTCDPYFICVAFGKGDQTINYQSKKQKENNNPDFSIGGIIDLYHVTRSDIKEGVLSKPVTIDLFDWNRFTKHVFLGRAVIDIKPDTFLEKDVVSFTVPLRDLKANEELLPNKKVTRTKSQKSVKDDARGQSKKKICSCMGWAPLQ